MSEVENKLVAAGVFAGMRGLEGFLHASEFWAGQPYGTRFYYGPGGLDYLHRSVLEAAVKILSEPPQASAAEQELEHLKAKYANLQARLSDVLAECEAVTK
jgi:hypothetical protein